jgi:hypothetical protein
VVKGVPGSRIIGFDAASAGSGQHMAGRCCALANRWLVSIVELDQMDEKPCRVGG